MRILTNDNDLNTPTTSFFSRAKMLSVHQLSFAATATVTKRALDSGCHEWLGISLRPLPVTRTSKGELEPPRHKSNMRGEALAVKAVKVYNHLPDDLKSLPVHLFKRRVKAWVKDSIPAKPP